MTKLRIGVFASGGGSNLQSIIDQAAAGKLDAEVAVVISNNSQAGALERATKHGIPKYHLSSKQFAGEADFTRKLLAVLTQHGVELIVLAGYMKKMPIEVLRAYKDRMLNIHPALLPAFGGQGMYGHHVHEAVLARGCKVSGVTVHLVDEEYDNGPIVAQGCVPVQDTDTPETLAARVLVEEHRLYPVAIQLFAQGRIKVIDRKAVRI
jgi:phosphoribosylglycinamide formyltransferase-1